MPYIEPEVILEAKKMDLLTYLQNYEPQELVHVSGNVYCTKTHDSLRISNGLWCWYSQGIGARSALDYLIKVNGYSFLDAVEQIMGRAAVRPPVFIPAKKESEKILLLPPAYDSTEIVTAYLTGRGIGAGIIRFCIETGRIYESHNYVEESGKSYVNAVFVGFDKTGNQKYATLRGIRTDFKGEATGSDKHYSFAIPAKQPSSSVHLFESAVDLISYATLLKMNGRDFRSENLLSLAGVYQPKKQIEESKVPAALTRFLQDHPHVKKVALHLDNDYAGRLAAKAIMTVLPKEYESANNPPSRGKDCNDFLCIRLGLATTKTKERTNIR